jgi:hypothetical protein
MIMCHWTKIGRCIPWRSFPWNDASLTDLTPTWIAYMRWVVITTATRRNLGHMRDTSARIYRPSFRKNKPKTRSLKSGPGVSKDSLWHMGCIKNAPGLYSPDLTYISQQNVSLPSFSKVGILRGRIVQRTHCPKDACIIQGAHRLRTFIRDTSLVDE